MSFIGTREFYLEVKKGKVPGHSIVNLKCENPLVGTSFEDLWDAGGTLVYPTVNESVEILSTASDTAAGTGAQEVTITYMDNTYVEQTPVVVATNGGTQSTGITDYFRIIDFEVTDAGSGKTNAGPITLRVSGGGATRARISTGNVGILDSHYTVPAGQVAFLIQLYNEINKNEDIVMEYLRTTGTNGIFRTTVTTSLYQDQFGMAFAGPGDAMVEKTDFRIRCVSSNTNARAFAFAQFIVIDSDLVSL